MPQEFDVVCLGGGVAGEAIAVGLQDSGLTLAVVERELVGGECPYWGCVPSKTLLRSGETLSEADRARLLAASRVEWTVDFPKVSKRVLWMARNLDDSRPAAAMEATGAKLFRGEGKLTDLRTVQVGSEQLIARRAVVIANGSTAAIPPIPGLDTIEFWTNRQAAIPSELPASLAILGGGAIGVELGQAFARLGSTVTVIEAAPTFLGLEEPEAGAALRPHLEADGITLMIGDPCVAVEKQSTGPLSPASSRQGSAVVHLKSGAVVSADRLLVATGRRPNVEAWRATGIAQTERGWLKVDPATLEARAGIFGAGDVTGLGGFTHLAYYHGQVVARRLRGMDARADHTAVPRVTFTDPEIASVGLSEAVARGRGIDVVVARTDPAETARGYIHDFHGGALKLVGDRKRGVLIGATLVTPRAGEILGELVLAIKLGTPLKTLADVIHPFPAFNRVLGESLAELAAKVA
ncbi:MAG TPA: NAD(P)/FAD-dependent oxidoreductase [Candidatus Eisenbacteria bacterium]|nr:NAD(P)/FAD-dependent oxidoreductase [Candidatus Eisenbacteria bacterium]